MVNRNSVTTLTAGYKIGKFRRDYAAKDIAFAPAMLSVAGKIHLEFLRLLWVLADMQTVKYFNLVGDEKDIGNERRIGVIGALVLILPSETV